MYINRRKYRQKESHLVFVIMFVKFSSLLLFLAVVINGQKLELDYLFPSMIFEPAMKLTPPFQRDVYYYSFIIPPPSKLYGPHVAFYLFAGQPRNKTAEIVINQDGQFFQILSEKQYWQSNKIPISLTVNKTTIDLHIRDGDSTGPIYTIHAIRASAS